MALEGTIKDFGLPDIFQLIGLQRKTGHLNLSNDKESVTVTFENGMVVMADSSSKRLEDRLGNVLVKQGKLGKERLEEALETQKQTLQRLGHILATSSFITGKDLRDALQVQVSQIVFKVFRWRDGHYNFEPADIVDYDRENFTPMSADFILMEGIRMVDEWPIIEKKITSMDMVFRPVVDAAMIDVGPADDGSGSEAKRGAGPSNKIRLTVDEERIYRKVDGSRTVQALIDASGGGEFEVCRTLLDLLNRNIVVPVGRGVTPESEDTEGETLVSSTPGYAVVGLVVLLAGAGIFAQRKSPFAITGFAPWLQGTYSRLLDSSDLARLRRLDRAVQAFHLIKATLPTRLEDLVSAGLVDGSYLSDRRDRPFHYEPQGKAYLLSAVDDKGKNVPGSVIERTVSGERQ
jgi:Domain of unknown function (DUF4388)